MRDKVYTMIRRSKYDNHNQYSIELEKAYQRYHPTEQLDWKAEYRSSYNKEEKEWHYWQRIIRIKNSYQRSYNKRDNTSVEGERVVEDSS